MKTTRWDLIGLALVKLGIGCAAATSPEDPEEESGDAELGAAAWIAEGSPEARGLLDLVNTAAVEVLDDEVALASKAARNIAAHRDGADAAAGTGDDDPFDTVAEVDAVPNVGPKSLEKLLAYAVAHGFVREAELRVRLAPEVPADGVTRVPVFVDVLDPAAAGLGYVLSISPPWAGTISPQPMTIGPTSPVGEWRHPHRALGYYRPCDVTVDPSCAGPVTVRVARFDEPAAILAESTIELVAPGAGLSPAACTGGGNVADHSFLMAAGYSVGIAAHSTWVHGPWFAAFARQDYANAPGFDRLYLGPHEHPSFTFRRTEIEAGVPYEAWANGGAEGSIEIANTCGKGRFLVHELETGPQGPLQIAKVNRATVAWELTCAMYQGGQKVERVLRGCIHYDRDNPVLE